MYISDSYRDCFPFYSKFRFKSLKLHDFYNCKIFASSIEDDILGDIRTKIEAKIRNCEDMIEVPSTSHQHKTVKLSKKGRRDKLGYALIFLVFGAKKFIKFVGPVYRAEQIV